MNVLLEPALGTSRSETHPPHSGDEPLGPVWHDAAWAGWSCRVGKTRRRSEIGGRSLASPRLCRPSFRPRFCPARWAGRSCRRRRGWPSIPIGARIRCAPIVWRGRSLDAVEHLLAGRGASGIVARADCRPRSARRPHHTANAPLGASPDFAACAGSQSIVSVGTSICGAAVQTKMPAGIAPA